MAFPAFDDPREFLEDFGVDAVLQPSSGAAITVRGIFDEAYIDARAGSYDMATGRPAFRCMAADAAAMRKHDTATISGVLYYLDHDPLPDGHGHSALLLSRDTDEI